jgi:hypothetical protein
MHHLAGRLEAMEAAGYRERVLTFCDGHNLLFMADAQSLI